MASKRLLKKQVKYACGDLAAECILAIHFVDGINVEKMQDVVFQIASLQTLVLEKVSFSYDKVKSDFETAVQEIVKSMNALLPQAQKDANKEAIKQ